MKPYPFAGLALLLAAATAFSQAQPQTQIQKESLSQPVSAVVVRDFDIYLDPPTGFVFVKLPQGWKFVGKVDEPVLASLPRNVHTSLLPDDRDGVVASDSDRATRR